MRRLSNACLSLYADLLQKSIDDKIIHGESFVSKTIDEKKYWYVQNNGLNQRQRYLGKETRELLDQIERDRSRINERKRIVAMLGAGGAHIEKGMAARVISRLHDIGVFSSGGVIVGSFAYSCYGNMLGVSLNESLMRTEDMDISANRKIDISLGDVAKNVELSIAGFNYPKQINANMDNFYLIDDRGFKIEFLTTKRHPSECSPIKIDRFNMFAQPLDYMDFLIESPQSAVIISGCGIPVSVPDPARFALHKLAISELRPISFQSKIAKDLAQAESLLEVLLDDNEGAILLAVDAIMARKDLFANFVRAGASKMSDETRARLSSLVELPVARWNTTKGEAEMIIEQGSQLPRY